MEGRRKQIKSSQVAPASPVEPPMVPPADGAAPPFESNTQADNRRKEGWFQRLDEMIYVVVRRGRMQLKLKRLIVLQLRHSFQHHEHCPANMNDSMTDPVAEAETMLEGSSGTPASYD